MNRLSEYITGMTLTRQLLKEARFQMQTKNADKHTRALAYLIDSFDAFVKATSCAVSFRTGSKPKQKRRIKS